jgi:ABC-2 type transport system ATP-binding protein
MWTTGIAPSRCRPSVSDAIRLEGVGKRYWKLEEAGSRWRSVLPFGRVRRSELWALRNVDLAVAPGETIGVMGRNGSGKTTMLRLLSGVSQPSEGRLAIRGRIAPLIGVGVGFHPEMSGRDNVYINGLLLGLTEEEIAERFDDIVTFAELREFIETPVKFYSSGMFVRLGFSVAVHCDPRVLLVDEVLAVGDLVFQMKCIRRMQLLQQRGTTIVIVSHAIRAIRDLCPRAILLAHGEVVHDGTSEAAIAHYMEILSSEGLEDSDELVRSGFARRTQGGVTVLDRVLRDADGPIAYLPSGEVMEYRMRVRFDRTVANPLFGLNVQPEGGHNASYGIHTPLAMEHRTFQPGEETEVVFRLVNTLGGGTYRLTSVISSGDSRELYGGDQEGLLLHVPNVVNAYGWADMHGTISVDGSELVEDRSLRLEAGPPPTAPVSWDRDSQTG